jgi:UDP-glucose 4-epimerase
LANILDESAMERALDGVDVVFHLAARVTIRGSVEHFVEDAQCNVMGTLTLLRIAGKMRTRRFVFASSMAVYGDSAQATPIPETFETAPLSPYGAGKLAAERYVLLVGPMAGVEPVVLRYFNTFGIGQTITPYVGVVTIFTTSLLEGKPIVIFGDGEQVRDFVHVSDIVRANILVMDAKEAAGEVFNVGTGRGTSVWELSELLMQRLNPNAVVQCREARAEELRNSIADVSKLERLVGYVSKTDLRHQIDEVVESVSVR